MRLTVETLNVVGAETGKIVAKFIQLHSRERVPVRIFRFVSHSHRILAYSLCIRYWG